MFQKRYLTGFVALAALALGACQEQESPVAPQPQAAISPTSALSSGPLVQAPPRAPASGVAFRSQTGASVPASVIVTYDGLEWVWASPCALNGCTAGILVGKDGFNFATADQWAKRPPVSLMVGKCAAPWFDQSHDHCDYGDAQSSSEWYGSAPYNGTGQVGRNGGTNRMVFTAETWLVRGEVEPADETAPVISASVVGTLGNNDWYTSDVTVAWTVTDDESDITAQDGCTVSSVTENTAGVTFTCSATSEGGSASESVTIKRDATSPAVSYAGNAGAYTIDQTVAITCSASDDMSGVATTDCADVNGAAYSFALGTNNFSASATDHAGNTGTGETSFTVSVTHASLCALTRSMVSKAGVADALCAKLDAAAASAARGNANASSNQIGAYVNQLNAQSGKAISADNAALLIALANSL